MQDIFTRFSQDLIGRLTGPLSFRFILQPVMSTIFAIRDGVQDAREGKPAYLWSLFTDPSHRRAQLREMWASVGRVALFALAMDLIYQIIVFHEVYLGEALVTSIVLAIVPYVLLRGPVNRIARHWMRGRIASRPV
jgi:hypothetical protein